ncbi:MAG: hypothetical protein NVS3B21_04420 [Acidimicrobiales bacterium]
MDSPSTTGATPTTTATGATVTAVPKGSTSPGVIAGPGTAAAAPAVPPTVAGANNKPATGAPLPAKAGTYRYHQMGEATFGTSTQPVPPEGSLKVDPASADGNQVSHRTVDPNQPPSDTVVAFRNGGVFLVRLVIRANAGGRETTFTCTFDKPLATPPWPPKVGDTYTGHADCGQFTIDVSGRVTAKKEVVLQQVTHHTFELMSALTFHGQLEGSGSQTDWLEPTSSLVLHNESTQNGTYGGVVKFSTHAISDLLSTTPS